LTPSMSIALDWAHEFWRMQLLDELHGKLAALDYEPQLDPSGRRRQALDALIGHFERIESEELRERRKERGIAGGLPR
jgi:hypothetical protein